MGVNGGMISNQILQNTIDGIRDIAHLDLCVLEADGKEVVSTRPVFENAPDAVAEFTASQADSQAYGPFQYFKVFDETHLEYILVVRGNTDNSLLAGKMAAYQIQGLLGAFKEHYDRDGFMKNLLLDNLLLIDIYERAKKLHIQVNSRRVVLLAELDRRAGREHDLLTLLQQMPGTNQNDFVTQVDEQNIVVVKDVTGSEEDAFIRRYAESALQCLQDAGLHESRIAYGTVVGELKEISHSYKEAKMALDVSKIFFEDKNVIAYNQLGIGRLIYQLPLPLCRMFINEIFKDRKPDEFDEETLTTIEKFFENNLNVSETSRQLFIHRNTLVYRLDKLQRSTGLDLRVFEDAITFKIALMVVKYMKYMDRENS